MVPVDGLLVLNRLIHFRASKRTNPCVAELRDDLADLAQAMIEGRPDLAEKAIGHHGPAPHGPINAAVEACDRCIAARKACVVVAQP